VLEHNAAEASGVKGQMAGAGSKGNWPVHVALVAWAILAVSLEHWFPGWGVPVGITGLVVGLTIYAGKRLWGRVWFWTATAIWAVIQVPLMIHVQPLIIRFKLLFTFPLAIIVFLAFGVILQILCLIFGVDRVNFDSLKSR
jgi:hypothetical protein